MVEGNRVHAVGDHLDAEIRHADQVIDLEGRVILPGFVDAHTHLIFGGNRVREFGMRCAGASYEEIAKAGGGIRSTIAATRGLPYDHLLGIGLRHANWMLRCGTTTAEAKSGYGMDATTEAHLLRAIAAVGERSPLRTVPTYLALHAIPEGWSRADFVDDVIERQLPACAQLARYVDAFVETNYFDHDDAVRLVAAAKALGLGVRLHVDQLTDNRGAELAAALGADTADHLEQTGEAGIQALAAAGVIPVLLPASVHCLGKHRYPDARRMIEASLPVVIATDFNPGSSPTPSLPLAMNLACTQMGMTPDEALRGCTLHAAMSLGLEHRVGDLAPGLQADFSIWDCTHPHEVVYWVGAPLLTETWVAGNRVVEQKK
jgi:imidazolonepropionase